MWIIINYINLNVMSHFHFLILFFHICMSRTTIQTTIQTTQTQTIQTTPTPQTTQTTPQVAMAKNTTTAPTSPGLYTLGFTVGASVTAAVALMIILFMSITACQRAYKNRPKKPITPKKEKETKELEIVVVK